MLKEIEVYARLSKAVKDAGGQSAFARLHDCSPQLVNDVLNARRPLDSLLHTVGLRKATVYVEARRQDARPAPAGWETLSNVR